jgi:hypothetical protein
MRGCFFEFFRFCGASDYASVVLPHDPSDYASAEGALLQQ